MSFGLMEENKEIPRLRLIDIDKELPQESIGKTRKLVKNAFGVFGLSAKNKILKDEVKTLNRILTLKDGNALDFNRLAKCNLFINGFFINIPQMYRNTVSNMHPDRIIETKESSVRIRYNAKDNFSTLTKINIFDKGNVERGFIVARDTIFEGIRIPFDATFGYSSNGIRIGINMHCDSDGNLMGILEEWRGPYIFKKTVLGNGDVKEELVERDGPEKHYGQLMYNRKSTVLGINEIRIESWFYPHGIPDIEYSLNGYRMAKDDFDYVYNALKQPMYEKAYLTNIIQPSLIKEILSNRQK